MVDDDGDGYLDLERRRHRLAHEKEALAATKSLAKVHPQPDCAL
jgi:hypothetical protein